MDPESAKNGTITINQIMHIGMSNITLAFIWA